MTPLWLAALDHDPGADVVAILRDDADRQVALLCLWRDAERPHESAVQADPRIYDADGRQCWVSLAVVPPAVRPLADDPMVVHARRDVLRDGRPCAVTLLTADLVSVAGSLTVARADRPGQVAALRDDPFRRLWPTRLLQVGAHILGALVRPTGPVVERYASQPWPYDRFRSTGETDAS